MHYISCSRKRGRPKVFYQPRKNSLIERDCHTSKNYNHSLLSLLYAHQKITKGMFEAGLFLQYLNYRSSFFSSLTPCSRKSSLVTSIIKGNFRSPYLFEASAETNLSDLRAHKKWKHAEKILKNQSMQSYRDVKKIVIDNQVPSNWKHQEKINFKPLQVGLRIIEEEFFYSKA